MHQNVFAERHLVRQRIPIETETWVQPLVGFSGASFRRYLRPILLRKVVLLRLPPSHQLSCLQKQRPFLTILVKNRQLFRNIDPGSSARTDGHGTCCN